jgi:hypothetical protein
VPRAVGAEASGSVIHVNHFHQAYRRPEDDPHGAAMSQAEADVMARYLDLDDVAYLQVYWVPGFGGKQPLIQPVRAHDLDRVDN